MKKGRQGTLLSVLCTSETRKALEALLLKETPTIGLRVKGVEKVELARSFSTFPFMGRVFKLKRVYWSGQPLKYKLEHDDLVAGAEALAIGLERLRAMIGAYLEADEKWKTL